jgi:hypothetical protein
MEYCIAAQTHSCSLVQAYTSACLIAYSSRPGCWRGQASASDYTTGVALGRPMRAENDRDGSGWGLVLLKYMTSSRPRHGIAVCSHA